MIYNVGGGASSADKINYDNSTSGIQATNVQGAIDEVNQRLTDEPTLLLSNKSLVTTGTEYTVEDITNFKYLYFITSTGANSIIPTSVFKNIQQSRTIAHDIITQGTAPYSTQYLLCALASYISDTRIRLTSNVGTTMTLSVYGIK